MLKRLKALFLKFSGLNSDTNNIIQILQQSHQKGKIALADSLAENKEVTPTSLKLTSALPLASVRVGFYFEITQ